MSKKKTKEEFIKDYFEKFPEKIGKIEFEGEYVNNKVKLWCHCLIDGYRWQASPNSLLRHKGGCPKCAGVVPWTHEEFVAKYFERYPDRQIEFLTQYVNQDVKILCKCLIDNTTWWALPSNLYDKGTGCPTCSLKYMKVLGEERTKTHEQFVAQFYEKFPDSKIEFLSEYIGANETIKCHCLIDDTYWDGRPSNLLTGYGCPTCAIRNHTKTHNAFIEEYYTKFPDSKIEFLSEYTTALDTIKCHCLNDWWIWDARPADLLKGHGCPKCMGRIARTPEEITELFNNKYKGKYSLVEESFNNYKNCFSILQIRNNTNGKILYAAPHIFLSKDISLVAIELYNNGKIDTLNRIIRLKLFGWNNDCYRLYNGKCILTESKEDNIVHHIFKNYSDIREEVFSQYKISYEDIDKLDENTISDIILQILEKHYEYGYGVVLNSALHNEFHHVYGRANNTPEQFIEFAHSKGVELEIKKTEQGMPYLAKKENSNAKDTND